MPYVYCEVITEFCLQSAGPQFHTSETERPCDSSAFWVLHLSPETVCLEVSVLQVSWHVAEL